MNEFNRTYMPVISQSMLMLLMMSANMSKEELWRWCRASQRDARAQFRRLEPMRSSPGHTLKRCSELAELSANFNSHAINGMNDLAVAFVFKSQELTDA